MTSDRKHFWMKVRLLAVARLLVASIVTASFLITVAPLGTASSAPDGMKDCCIGKPGHEAGACSSGLLASSGDPHHSVADDSEVASETSSALMAVSGGIHSQSSEASEPPQAESSRRNSINAVSRECRGECGTCSTSFSRQPRPREQSTLAYKARPHLLNSSLRLDTEFPSVNALKKTATQLRPRAPPLS